MNDSARGALADLRPELVAALGAVAAFLVVVAVGLQIGARRLRLELRAAEEELHDRATGLLPRSAVRVRLGAELAWAGTTGTPVAVAALRIRGSRFTHAARVLRGAMREEESAFLLGDQRVAVELWGVEAEEAAIATRRLGDQLARAGHPVVDAGIACAPRDGADVESLLAAAQRDLRPVDDPRPPGSADGAAGRAGGATGHALRLALGILPWFAAAALLLLVTWRLVPRAIEPAISEGSRSGGELALALIAGIGIPLGAALVHATCWNLGGGTAPSSRPLARVGVRLQLAIAAIVGVPLAWGICAPTWPSELADGFGASLAVLALVVLAFVPARQLVHVPAPLLALALVVGGVVTWFAVEQATLPVVANAGRLLAAAALGALLAQLVERASWIVVLGVMAGAIDAWSVYDDSGVTRQLLDEGSGAGSRIVDLLVFTAPSVDGAPLFGIGFTDLAFVALFLTWAHDWRLDVRVVTAVLIAGAWTALLIGDLSGEVVPMLPCFAIGIVLVVVTRSIALRSRVAAWRDGPGGDQAVG
ncbi:MAG: hypothetical protein JWM86_4 [Thermoleophilia bacterium]|nr:hypothetical protein [Thermoleophilia bacterium]